MIISLLRSYLSQLPNKYYPLVMSSFLLSLFLAFTEGVGLLLLIPLMSLSGVTTEESGSLPEYLMLFLEKTGIELTLERALFLYVIILSLFALLRFLQSYLSLYISESITKEQKDRLFSQVLRSRWSFLTALKSSDIIHILSGRVGVYGSMIQSVISLILAVVMLGAYGVIACAISFPMTLLSVGSALSIAVVLMPVNKKIYQVGQRLFNANKEIHSVLKESVEGIKTAKAYSIESRSESLFATASESLKENLLRFIKLSQATQALYKIGAVITISGIFYIAITIFHFDVVQLFLFILIFSRVIPQISNIHSMYQSLINTVPTYREVELLNANTLQNQESVAQRDVAIAFHDTISLQGVHFTYGNESNFALEDISLSLKKGNHLALIGHTGSGKSTLIDILMGLLEFDRGRLTVDGREIQKDEWKSFRALTSYVPQEPFFFHDTIRENIRMVQREVRDEEIWKVLDLVQAKEMVEAFPQGLDTIIGDRGITISGGERQRIALARAIIVKPEILILDEATNALDNSTEEKVYDALREQSGIETLITITHKTENLHKMDEVVVMKEGAIVATAEAICKSEIDRLLSKLY